VFVGTGKATPSLRAIGFTNNGKPLTGDHETH
jgi:hypothetical protein